MYIKHHIISLYLLLQLGNAGAQDITGTWEGDLGNDQFIQLNVIQVKNSLCGYTWDYVNNNHKSFCKAFFTGYYNKKRKEWVLEGESFVENSGAHILMKIKLTTAIVEGKTILTGTANTGSFAESIIGNMLESFFGKPVSPVEMGDQVTVRKVSNRPQKILDRMKDCYEQEKKLKDPKDSVSNPTVKPKRTDSIVKATQPVIIKPVDSTVKVVKAVVIKPSDSKVTPPVVIKPGLLPIPKEMEKRKNNEESHVVVNTKNITLSVYDNAIIDGDTVSIFFNGKLLLSHQRLGEKAIVLNVELDENRTRNEILLFAENLGSIPPNTALIVVNAGDKRYELFSKASLEENAVLVFEYQPK